MKLILAFMTFTICAPALGAPCEETVSPRYLKFRDISDRIPRGPNPFSRMKYQDKFIEMFWRQTWPVLKERAAGQDKTVAEVLEEYHLLGDLIAESEPDFTAAQIADQKLKSVRNLEKVSALEKLDLNVKMKAARWDLVRSVHASMIELATFAIVLETTYRRSPSFNPLAAMTPTQLDKLFDSLEVAPLELAGNFIEIRRLRRERLENPIEEEATAPAEDTPAFTSLAIAPEEALEAPIDIDEDQLAVVVRHQLPLSTTTIYKVNSPHALELTVSIDASVVEESQGASMDAIYRLLRGLVGGNRFKSGIKTLFDIGENIVEVKNIVAGHKRLLGCLEGRHLRILKLESMGDTRASYFRQIPRNLCK